MAHSLVHMLLRRNAEETYERIGVFRQPDVEGPLSKSKLLQEAKPWLMNMIFR